jgi:predicted RNase H-like nuclease (RuvC/YqgF family)
MECNYCKNIFSSKTNLNHHQKRAKYCLEIQGKLSEQYECTGCKKSYTRIYDLKRHKHICKASDKLDEYLIQIQEYEQVMKEQKKDIHMKDQTIRDLKSEYKDLKSEYKDLKSEYKQTICDLQNKLENIALKAVSTSSTTNNTKNIQINNFLKNAPALTDQVIQDNIQYLTLEHHVQGAEGYAKYAMEFPFKGRIVCVDVSRNKIKYKDGDGNVIEDAGFQKMMMKLCKAIYGRSYDLSIEHLDKLAKQFTEKELEQYDYLEAAKAITMYSKGSESDFCRKIIKIISKSVGNN